MTCDDAIMEGYTELLADGASGYAWPDLLQPNNGHHHGYPGGGGGGGVAGEHQGLAGGASTTSHDEHFQALQEILGEGVFGQQEGGEAAKPGGGGAGGPELPRAPVPIHELQNTHKITAVTPPFSIQVCNTL